MDIEKRITAAWQGRISGCLLGKPVEVLSMREGHQKLNNFLNEGALENCNVIDGGCALHIKDGVDHKAIVFAQDKNAYLVNHHDEEILESPYLREEIF